MELDYLSILNCLIRFSSFIFFLLWKAFVMVLSFSGRKIYGIVYHAFVVYRKRFLNVVPKKPALVSRNIGWMLGLLPAVSASVKVDEERENKTNLISEADVLYNEHSYTKLRSLLLPYKAEDNAEILWRLARATYEVAKLSSSPIEQKELDFEAYGYVEGALLIDPENFAAHKWMFILLDKKASYEGLKERISQSFVVKKHIERACELNPKDATSFHLLGYWCFSVAELPWLQRQIASTLFATPPVSSYEEALQYFLRAEEVEPNFYSTNLLMLGKTYLRLNNKEKAIAYLTRARDYAIASSEDLEAKHEAVKLLNSIR
ncbi:regulator of microtubule dynamics protein 1-like isoform X2 [Daphnia pulex]|nr:regulator of microtubule dynamics protein 1-like isoform X2 [Daphnia pulex]